MITERTNCRLCSGLVEVKFKLTPTPIANNYSTEPDIHAERYPLELTQCVLCGHVQQRYVVSGLFDEYKYATPKTMIPYLTSVSEMLKSRYPQAKRVLEIGCNNGVFLDCLSASGFDVVGIDPASSHPKGIKAYFNSTEASRLSGPFDLVVSNNVFAHIDDLQDVFLGINSVLASNGAVIFEVQNFQDLVELGAFDMCYAEHMSHHTIKPLVRFLRNAGLVATKYERTPVQGGSIRVTAQRIGREVTCPDEQIDWDQFSNLVEWNRSYIRRNVSNKQVVLLGAAAKVTTLVHHCDIADHILFACDDETKKQGRYIPGTNIQIRPMSELGSHVALLGAWNYEPQWRIRFPDNRLINPFLRSQS